MAHIFISYAHDDKDFAKTLIDKLNDGGFSSWIDAEKLRAGKDWGTAIDTAIHESFALIVVMSEDAKNSEYVTYEWAYALGANIAVIPLILEKKMLDSEKLHTRLARLQYIPFDNHFNLTSAWQKLMEDLREIEDEYKSFPKPKSAEAIPTQVKQAVDVLRDPQYFNASMASEPNPLHLAVNNLISSRSPVAQQALIDALEHPNPEVRRVTIWAFGQTRNEQVVADLTSRIRDLDWQVRLEAVNALIQINNDKCERGLIDALDDQEHQVRALAAKGLGNFKTNASVSALMRTLQQDKTGTVRAVAAESLSAVGDTRAIVALTKRLADKDKSVRDNSANALISIGTPEALAAVEEWQRKQQDQP